MTMKSNRFPAGVAAVLVLALLPALQPQAFGELQSAGGDAQFLDMTQEIDSKIKALQWAKDLSLHVGLRGPYAAVRDGERYVCQNSEGEEGYNPVDLKALRQSKDGACGVLIEANLSMWNLDGANLSGARLDGAGLELSHLTSADLIGAWLYGAKLMNSTLSEAKLQGAMLDLANLTLAELPAADLSGAHLKGVTALMANLSFARLIKANLFGANLAGARMHGTVLNGAWLFMADLRRAKLEGALLGGANLSEADLRAAELDKVADWEGAQWTGAFFNDETQLPFPRETALALGMRHVSVPAQTDLPQHLLTAPAAATGPQ